MSELYKKYRPTQLSEVVGQEGIVKTLSRYDSENMPHMIILSGPTGSGKTTLARIIAKKLKADPNLGIIEMNCATETGIDFVRGLAESVNKLPIVGSKKVYILDECHQLTSQAQAGLLKMCEDAPKHVYYIFVTTNPEKIIKTLRNRGANWTLTGLTTSNLTAVLDRVASAEKIELTEEETGLIIALADGSARQALQLLEVLSKLDNSSDRKQALRQANPLLGTSEGGEETGAFFIARALASGGSWSTVANLLKECKDEPETVRHVVLAYARTMLLNSGKAEAAMIIEAFQYDFLQSKQAGLALACFRVCKKKG